MIPIISAEEITSPNSELGSDHEFGSSILNPVIRTSNRDLQAPSRGGRARARGSAVTDPSRSGPQADSGSRKVRFSSLLAPDPGDDIPDDYPVVLVPNSSDPNLAGRANPDPSNQIFQSSSLSPPPFPSPHLLFVQSHPRSLERAPGRRVSAVDSDMEHELGEKDAFVPPITVSTQPKTTNGDLVSGGLRVNNGKNLERREEAENVDHHQSGADSPLGSQDPAETPGGNVQDCIEPQGVRPNSTTDVWESELQHAEGGRQSPVASQPTNVPERAENSKPIESPNSYFNLLTNNRHRFESEARNKLQAEVEGDEEGDEVVGAPKAISDSNGPPHSTLVPPLGRMLSLLDEAGPPRSVGGLGRAITRRPRRPIGGNRFSKRFQTQPPAEVESGWQSEGTSNVNARPGASKSDDLSFFAGL